jgi:hypothetical protein
MRWIGGGLGPGESSEFSKEIPNPRAASRHSPSSNATNIRLSARISPVFRGLSRVGSFLEPRFSWTSESKRRIFGNREDRGREARREPCWWRGLDSNQRTLARADLQSAAFNHSATPPGWRTRRPRNWPGMAIRRAKWRRTPHVSTRPRRKSCQRHCLRAPRLTSGIFELRGVAVATSRTISGAGEGNRTLVVSLEGFCSTIELHPLCKLAMPFGDRSRQPSEVDRARNPELGSDSHEVPGRHRCTLGR